MNASVVDWPAAVLKHLALSPAARLTLALDPDGLLLAEPALSAIEAQGVGLLTYAPERFAAFRYTYEADYRCHWTDDESPRLLARVASTKPNTFPYDLLVQDGGREQARSLALFEFFPRLAYPVLRELAQYDRSALPRLHDAYRIHPPQQRLAALPARIRLRCYARSRP